MFWHSDVRQWRCRACNESQPVGRTVADLYPDRRWHPPPSDTEACGDCDDADDGPSQTPDRSAATTSRDSRPPPRRTTHRSRRLHTRAPADLAASCACPHGCDRPAAPGLPYCDDCYGTMCECTCEPCARRLLPETRVHPLQRAAWAPCVRPGCPCTASWNGLPGEFCCRTCRGGQACAHNYHRQPFVVDTTETLPMSSLGPEEAM